MWISFLTTCNRSSNITVQKSCLMENYDLYIEIVVGIWKNVANTWRNTEKVEYDSFTDVTRMNFFEIDLEFEEIFKNHWKFDKNFIKIFHNNRILKKNLVVYKNDWNYDAILIEIFINNLILWKNFIVYKKKIWIFTRSFQNI